MKNTIHQIQDPSGSIWKDSDHIQTTFLSYFNNIFTSKNPNIRTDMLDVVKNRISPPNFNILNSFFFPRGDRGHQVP